MDKIQAYLHKRNASIADFLQRMRKHRGWSQQQVADLLQLSRQTIVRMEKGEAPYSMAQVELLCRAFGYTPHDFYQSDVGRGKRFEHDLEMALENKILPGILGEPIALPMPDGYFTDQADTMTFSPDGAMLALAAGYSASHGSNDDSGEVSGFCAVLVWDTKGQVQHTLTVDDIVSGLAFSPDSRYLAAVLRDGQIVTWQMQTGQASGQLEGLAELYSLDNLDESQPLPGADIAFSPNQQYLAVAYSNSNQIRLVAHNQGDCQETGLIEAPANITALAFSPDSRIVFAVAGDEGLVYGYTVPAGDPWPDARHPDAYGAINSYVHQIAVFSSHRPTEFFAMYGGQGEALDVWYSELMPDSKLSLTRRFFSLPARSDGDLAQIVPVNPNCILTVVNLQVKDELPFVTDEIHNVFKIRNAVNNLTVTILDKVHYTPDFYRHALGVTEWVTISHDGTQVAVSDGDGLRIHPFDVDSLTLELQGQPGHLLDVDYDQLFGLGQLETDRSAPDLPADTLDEFEGTPVQAPTRRLARLIKNPKQQHGVVIVPRDDAGIVNKIRQAVRQVDSDKTILVAVIPEIKGRNRSRVLAGALLEAAGQDWPRRGRPTEVLTAITVPQEVFKVADVIIIDHAERLGEQELHYLKRSSDRSDKPVVILVGRSEKLITRLQRDFSLARRTTSLQDEDFL